MKLCFQTLATSAAFVCGISLGSPAAFAAPLSPVDHDFLVSTAQGTTYELAAAKLALTKGSRSDVKSYAQTMIDDHASLNPMLHDLAKQNGVDLPTAMTKAKQKSYDHLESLDGKAFDTAFVKEEAQDNENDIADEKKEIDATDNAPMKAFVEKLKQTDSKHAELGQALQHAGQ